MLLSGHIWLGFMKLTKIKRCKCKIKSKLKIFQDESNYRIPPIPVRVYIWQHVPIKHAHKHVSFIAYHKKSPIDHTFYRNQYKTETTKFSFLSSILTKFITIIYLKRINTSAMSIHKIYFIITIGSFRTYFAWWLF